jgi:Protein of unknown function (DUF3224)
MTKHAKGTFEVTITPEAQGTDQASGIATARMALAKTFKGDFNGKASGTMLSAGAPKAGSAASYVAIDQVCGTLEGKSGCFVLVHRGILSKSGSQDLELKIATDSGTGALEGIAGSLTITVKDSKHYYDLEYTIAG